MMLFLKFIDKECSILVIEHMYVSYDNVDTESTTLGDSQSLAYVIVRPSLIYIGNILRIIHLIELNNEFGSKFLEKRKKA